MQLIFDFVLVLGLLCLKNFCLYTCVCMYPEVKFWICRNYPDSASLKFSDEAIVSFHGSKLEPFHMEGFFERGSASVPKKKDELQDEWQKTAHVTPRSYNEPPVILEKLSLFDVQVVTNRLLDVLHPGETVCVFQFSVSYLVCKALRRLKEHQPIFYQVTEDVMLLVENGNIGIYESTKEEIWQKANSNEVIDENVPNLFYFDAASRLYYDGTSGKYYDPTSGYYCCYASGFWYRYNDNTESWELM